MQLLISVKNVEEALLALNAGADLIDLKDPEVGALGALDVATTHEIVRFLKQKSINNSYFISATISATVGENHETLAQLLADIELRANAGVDIIKIAASKFFYHVDFYDEIKKFSKNGLKIVAVFFADEGLDLAVDFTIFSGLKNAGFYGAMLDTKHKQIGLLQVQMTSHLRLFIQQCQQFDLSAGLAGSLQIQDIDKLQYLNPTYIGFRGGLCESEQRELALSAEKVRNAKNMLRNGNKNHINTHLI